MNDSKSSDNQKSIDQHELMNGIVICYGHTRYGRLVDGGNMLCPIRSIV
jgi:hypothetical protein